jgi:protein-S-isoprenylcysteine O-methyltransferase Ste14
MLLFGAFLIAGPFIIIPFDVSEAQGLVWDGALSLLFFVQHSGMVRQSIQTRLSAVIPPCYSPATYAIASGTVLFAVVLLWQTSQMTVLAFPGPLQWLLRAISLLAIAGSLWGIRALRTFDAFGREAIASCLRGEQQGPPSFVVRGPYVWVRHPLYFFTLVLIWFTPNLTADRFLFNLLWTAWIVVGSYLEERDLVAEFGERYRHYQRTVPMLLPWRGPVGREP